MKKVIAFLVLGCILMASGCATIDKTMYNMAWTEKRMLIETSE